MEKVLTVVIPTYNMEKYLKECLNSFIYDEKEEALEVLVVNDGSKDNSLNIAKEYEKKYPNIFKVIDKENGGHGSTINAGLKVARGKYFKVVDSDDWVDTSEFKILVEKLKTLDVDCVVCNYTSVFEGSKKTKKFNNSMAEYNEICAIKNAKEFKFYMAATTFKTEKIKNIIIDEKCFYVDTEYNEFCVGKCENFVNLNLDVYRYRVGRVGQSVSRQGFLKHRFDHLKVIEKLINNLDVTKNNVILKDCIEIICHHYTNYVYIYSLNKETVDELKQFNEYLKQHKCLYEMTNKIKKIRILRNTNFKIIKLLAFCLTIKIFIKKILFIN